MPVYLGDKKVSIFAGAGAAQMQEKSVVPTESQQTVTPDTGYFYLHWKQSHQEIRPDLHSGNLRSDDWFRTVFERNSDDQG